MTQTPTRAATAASTPSRPRASRVAGSAALVLALLVLAVVCVLSLKYGARTVAWSTVWQAWTDHDPADTDHTVVRARLPRTVVAVAVGAALGLAGAAMQGLARNPLADPGILGINAGASLAVVIALFVFGLSSLQAYIWFALAGAAVAGVVVYTVASIGREGATPVKLALAGAAFNAGIVSLTSAVLVSSRQTLDTFRFWQVGAVAGRGWDEVRTVAPFLLVGLLLTLATGRVLNALALGDDVARGLGQRVGLTRVVTGLGVVLLCGGATALAGPIGFVGLVVPHILRGFVAGDYRWILPGSALLGAVLVVVADIIGRVALPPGEVPAGVMTAVIGGPVFVWLVRRRKSVATS